MIQWKQRLYAFLLRRALGPFLDDLSLAQLHQSIDVSFQEGRFTLTNVGLNTAYLTEKCQHLICFRTARADRLEIYLTVTEKQSTKTVDDQTTAGVQSSLAWRAMKLGSPSVSLVAHVSIEGVLLEIMPGHGTMPPTSIIPPPPDGVNTGSATGMLASYIDAALASLRLSVDLKAVCIRAYNSSTAFCVPKKQPTETGVELQLKSASYHDVKTPENSDITNQLYNYETVMHKALNINTLTIVAGEFLETTLKSAAGKSQSNAHIRHDVSHVALLDGLSQISLRAVAYKSDQCSGDKSPPQQRIQQDVEINFSQKLHVSLDHKSFRLLYFMVDSFRSGFLPSNSSSVTMKDQHTSLQRDTIFSAPLGQQDKMIDDRADLNTIDGIMKQYQENRLHVTKNQKHFQGGILLPSGDNNDDSASFDVFFDANDASFARYSTTLKQSIIMAAQEGGIFNEESPSYFDHTKIKLHLQQGGMKLVFLTDEPGNDQCSDLNKFSKATKRRRADEYILITFTDLIVNCNIALHEMDFSLSLLQLDIEDSCQVQHVKSETSFMNQSRLYATSVGKKIEIGSVLKFPMSCEGRDLGDSDVLLQAPCVALIYKFSRKEHMTKHDVELSVEPLELTYRAKTIDNFTNFLSILVSHTMREQVKSSDSKPSNLTMDKPRLLKRKFNVSCPSLTLLVPILADHDWDLLHRRCGHWRDKDWSKGASIDFLMSNLFILITNNDYDGSGPDLMFEFGHVILYANSPTCSGLVGGKSRQFDILTFTGRTEVDPCIPILLKMWRNVGHTNGTGNAINHGKRTFPETPSISSFKAHQEDEDNDTRIDRVLASKLDGSNVGSRSDLRGNDPQADMLSQASEAIYTFEIFLPEVMVDLTVDELSLFIEMLTNVLPKRMDEKEVQTEQKRIEHSSRVACSVQCNFFSFALHNKLVVGVDNDDHDPFSIILHLFDFQAHALYDGVIMKQLRLLCYEFVVYEGFDLIKMTEDESFSSNIENRVERFRSRPTRSSNSTATPVFHRSHLFSSISQLSPSILIDVMKIDHLQQNIHVTVYDMTYRCDIFSKFFQYLQQALQLITPNNDVAAIGEKNENQLLMRVFFSLSDCNVDYSSSPCLKTPSRLMVRVGDLRMSANLLRPEPRVQTLSFALGEVSIYICKTKFPYNFENSRLPRSFLMLKEHDISLTCVGISEHATCEIVQNAMSYITIAMLTSFDAVFALSNSNSISTGNPSIQANLTIGELSIFACKDSFFKCFDALSEATTELTAFDRSALELLRTQSSKIAHFRNNTKTTTMKAKQRKPLKAATMETFEKLKKQSALRPVAGTTERHNCDNDFLLDGYDWTAIDQDTKLIRGVIPPDQEQVARWYSGNDVHDRDNYVEMTVMPAFEPLLPQGSSLDYHHFPLKPVTDPLGDGDMGVAKYAGINGDIPIQFRLLVHDMSFKLRCFDGYDWPELVDKRARLSAQKGIFLLDHRGDEEDVSVCEKDEAPYNKKEKLMHDLLAGDEESKKTFEEMPLPEERGAKLMETFELGKLYRRTGKYFQFSAAGVSLRLDKMELSSEHKLQSCMNLRVEDFFLAETISRDRPVKLVGEWVNDAHHPRDSNDGLITMQIFTWHPMVRVSSNNEIASDECEAVVELLPLRCTVDQRAIRFLMAFFSTNPKSAGSLPAGRYAYPPPLFRLFRIKPLKLKIDYRPEKLDTKALRDGALVELINLSPIDGMVLTLQQIDANGVVGYGEVLTIACRNWIKDICSTQIFKFITNSRPLEPISSVGSGASDLIVLPWEALQNGEDVQKALRAGAKSFSSTILYEAFKVTSHASKYFADTVAIWTTENSNAVLPSRPLSGPRRFLDTTPHILETIGRGFQHANYKIVIVPYREYRRSGAKGVATSILKGIPVAIALPASATAEALSFALLGVQNQLRPEIRQEEDANQRGLQLDW